MSAFSLFLLFSCAGLASLRTMSDTEYMQTAPYWTWFTGEIMKGAPVGMTHEGRQYRYGYSRNHDPKSNHSLIIVEPNLEQKRLTLRHYQQFEYTVNNKDIAQFQSYEQRTLRLVHMGFHCCEWTRVNLVTEGVDRFSGKLTVGHDGFIGTIQLANEVLMVVITKNNQILTNYKRFPNQTGHIRDVNIVCLHRDEIDDYMSSHNIFTGLTEPIYIRERYKSLPPRTTTTTTTTTQKPRTIGSNVSTSTVNIVTYTTGEPFKNFMECHRSPTDFVYCEEEGADAIQTTHTESRETPTGGDNTTTTTTDDGRDLDYDY